MGQSQSQIEKNKQRPVNPQRIYGFIFFQRYYDEVLQTKRDVAKQKYNEILMTQAETYFSDVFSRGMKSDEASALW